MISKQRMSPTVLRRAYTAVPIILSQVLVHQLYEVRYVKGKCEDAQSTQNAQNARDAAEINKKVEWARNRGLSGAWVKERHTTQTGNGMQKGTDMRRSCMSASAAEQSEEAAKWRWIATDDGERQNRRENQAVKEAYNEDRGHTVCIRFSEVLRNPSQATTIRRDPPRRREFVEMQERSARKKRASCGSQSSGVARPVRISYDSAGGHTHDVNDAHADVGQRGTAGVSSACEGTGGGRIAVVGGCEASKRRERWLRDENGGCRRIAGAMYNTGDLAGCGEGKSAVAGKERLAVDDDASRPKSSRHRSGRLPNQLRRQVTQCGNERDKCRDEPLNGGNARWWLDGGEKQMTGLPSLDEPINARGRIRQFPKFRPHRAPG
ncbi:hypothetical protein C8R47DRAFT_1066608 [Mycena vitilis]|nr:hypothetical protein C8R47DRAFT_1066608 [Mycena vitilis]